MYSESALLIPPKCKLNGKYIKLGEQEIIETETSKQTCTCLEASRTSCMIEAKPPAVKSAEDVSHSKFVGGPVFKRLANT